MPIRNIFAFRQEHPPDVNHIVSTFVLIIHNIQSMSTMRVTIVSNV